MEYEWMLKRDLDEIKERLAAVESMLQRLPEVQAVTLFLMYDEYKHAQLIGKRASDLWEIAKPDTNHETL